MTDQERAAREEVLRIVGATQIGDEIGNVLGGVPGRRHAPHGELADVDDVTVLVRRVRVSERRILARVDRDRPKVRKRARARDVVVVDMRFERVADEDTDAGSRGEIGVDVPVGIDEERDARVGIRDEVARVSDPGVKELFDQQLARTLARVPLRSRLLTNGLGLLFQDFFARTEIPIVWCDHRRYSLVDALALRFGFVE
ncbi:MAG: hypothetical protein AUH39_03530 [Chloroflexi bacterium 13_1_40CM_67_9]|nr:MAG: hypothetical protein AUH39_03530 [Chloroflexi bacterium 13_1_40CM_67_9]